MKRWQTIKTDEDVEKITVDLKEYCDKTRCSDCEYESVCVYSGVYAVYGRYLLEEVNE